MSDSFTPLVSVIVPTYNQAKYLRACLDSIWFQDFEEHIEIVLVNDGATDNTAEVIAAFLHDKDDARASFASYYNAETDRIERIVHSRYPAEGRSVTHIDHVVNRGLAPALNTGFRAARGRYCTYVPSDDMCFPSMMRELVSALEQGNDFAYADMLITDDAGNVQRRFSLPQYSFKACFSDWYLCGVAKLYKTELHTRFGFYDEALLAHDHELFQRFAMGGAKFVHVPKAVMNVRAHDKEREVDIHAPENWNRLLMESKELVLAARKFEQDGNV